MSRRAIVTAIVAVAIVCVAYVAGHFTIVTANTIDDVSWKGDPVPPCFLNAAQCGGHLLGTDEIGRDLVARLIAASGPSLGMALLAALVACIIALILGNCARHGGRVVSYLVERAAEGISAIPRWLLLALGVVALSSGTNGVPHYGLALIAGAILWPRVTGLVLAGRPASALVPQVFRDWASAFLMLATLDFLGWGVQPPLPAWGNMLGIMEALVLTGWWAAVFPAVCIFVAVLVIEWAARTVEAPDEPRTPSGRSPDPA